LSKKEISLVSLGHFEKNFLEQMAREVSAVFGIPVIVSIAYQDISPYFEPARKQYDANRLLQLIHTEYAGTAVKAIGLFQVDLFIPILTYIFGQAIYNGNAGIASVYRLKNEQYGLPGNDELLFDRIKKVIVHELGHTFGLIHCRIPSCVMRSGTYVEDIDQKKHLFCKKCQSELDNSLSETNIFL
jgi:archaemetzincin